MTDAWHNFSGDLRLTYCISLVVISIIGATLSWSPFFSSLSSYGLIVTDAMESIVPILLGFELSSTGHDPVIFISVAA